MKKVLLCVLVLYSIVATYLLISSEIFPFKTIDRKVNAVKARNADFIELLPTCVVDLDTSIFYHESHMCRAFMAYEYKSNDTIITMTTYEAEIRGLEPCPLCDPAYKTYQKLK